MYDAIEYLHCVVIDKKLTAGGKSNSNPGVKCTHCSSVFSGGPSRIRGHILGISSRGGGSCTSDTTAAKQAKALFQKVEDAFEATRQKKRKRVELDEMTDGPGTRGARDSLVQKSIEDAFVPKLKENADDAVGRYFYGDGTPFIKVESDYFLDMVAAIGAYGSGYRPPSMKRLRTTMLDKEVENVKREMQVGGYY